MTDECESKVTITVTTPHGKDVYYEGMNGNCGDLCWKLRRGGALQVTYLTLSERGDAVERIFYARGQWLTVEITEHDPFPTPEDAPC